jgi:hypothetical protein
MAGMKLTGMNPLRNIPLPFFDYIQRWVAEPAPDHYFEITERSLSGASSRDASPPIVEMLEERGLTASPSVPNLLKPQLYRDALLKAFSGRSNAKRTRTALVIPDFAVRMAVLDFEEFPAVEEARMALLRFRLRKIVPFRIADAAICGNPGAWRFS